MTPTTKLHRQVSVSWIQNGEPTSQTFKPTPKDNSKVSVYNGDKYTAQEAFIHYTTVITLQSSGCVSVECQECSAESLNFVEDNDPYDGHSIIDFTGLSRGETERKAKKLLNLAMTRGWMYKVA